MSEGALSRALAADTDHAVCFASDGTEKGWQDLVAAASSVCTRIAKLDGERWALDLDDPFRFAAALVGCWAARRTPVLMPQSMLDSAGALVAVDGIVSDEPAVAGGRQCIVWSDLAAARSRICGLAADAQFVLYTSGSTGTPKEVVRHLRHVEAEIAGFESLWGERMAGARVHATVSHRHLYGFKFRVLWPLLARRAFAAFDLRYPEQLVDGAGAGHVLVSSPALLKRVGHLPPGSGGWRAAFTAGGVLPAAAAEDAARVLGVVVIEIFGSTETSAVAWRWAPGEAGFSPVPGVEIRTSGDDVLEVRSPFSGQGWLPTGDRVRPDGRGRFELLGRADHVAKIEDKRISLAEIEHYLLESPWVDEAAAVSLDDGARQCVGVVLQLSDGGARRLAERGRRAFNEDLRSLLLARIESVGMPRKFRYVDTMPVDALGKRTQAKLRDLFSTSP